jgi:hypothetical protein
VPEAIQAQSLFLQLGQQLLWDELLEQLAHPNHRGSPCSPVPRPIYLFCWNDCCFGCTGGATSTGTAAEATFTIAMLENSFFFFFYWSFHWLPLLQLCLLWSLVVMATWLANIDITVSHASLYFGNATGWSISVIPITRNPPPALLSFRVLMCNTLGIMPHSLACSNVCSSSSRCSSSAF